MYQRNTQGHVIRGQGHTLASGVTFVCQVTSFLSEDRRYYSVGISAGRLLFLVLWQSGFRKNGILVKKPL